MKLSLSSLALSRELMDMDMVKKKQGPVIATLISCIMLLVVAFFVATSGGKSKDVVKNSRTPSDGYDSIESRIKRECEKIFQYNRDMTLKCQLENTARTIFDDRQRQAAEAYRLSK